MRPSSKIHSWENGGKITPSDDKNESSHQMPTRLSKFCEGMMEAAWLTVVIVVPLFFNVYSSRIFEPDKIALLRSLALLILAAWVVKIVDEGKKSWEGLLKGMTRWETLKRTPLLIPVLALLILYGLATVFSVTPRVSLWGSYQRLQGTYTTLSYILVFAAMAVNMRHRDQVERLITTIILTSLPVSLYGVLQRYRIDPVPWGGDVSVRITANMGNSIFVAAYYIMVFPLTMGRIIEAFLSILNDRGNLMANFARATVYVFIVLLQVIALLFTGSRGPLLGWLAGAVFLFLALSLLWHRRWLTIAVIATAFALGVFLLLFNIPGGPLESLRTLPGIGRLGHLVDEESKTSRVRTLIWQGAAQLVLPHQPLEYPDGRTDTFNVLRPFIGYGPESMFVAYNPFFPPELTQVEKRGRTPDRSHNETWDTLVTTGLFGLLIYLTLVGSIFYYGLKWLGIISTPIQMKLFLSLLLGGSGLGAFTFIFWRGIGYFGVGLPFGMVAGIFLYTIWVALKGKYHTVQSEAEILRGLMLASLLAALLAHFVEINFGISIAATRTYFWVFSALLLVIGFTLPMFEEPHPIGRTKAEGIPINTEVTKPYKASLSYRRNKDAGETDKEKKYLLPKWVYTSLTLAGINVIIMVSLGFDFLTNVNNLTSALHVLWTSMINLPTVPGVISYGVLTMILITWLLSGIVLTSEDARQHPSQKWWRMLAFVLGTSLLLAGLYWIWHAAGLVDIVTYKVNDIGGVLAQLSRFENLLSRYYLYHFILILALSCLLTLPTLHREWKPFQWGIWIAPIALGVAIYLIWFTNLRVIQADIAYKRGEAYAKRGAWQPAIAVYQHALTLAPKEDYYYLFLGKAYADYGASLQDETRRDILFDQAVRLLEQAQRLNPLNADHTANLARLHSAWAQNTSDEQLKSKRAALANDYFSRAVRLSPNNSTLWLEWALFYIHVVPNPREAYLRLLKAVELDPTYDRIHAVMGDYYAQTAMQTTDEQQKQALLHQAVEAYQQALNCANPSDVYLQNAYLNALASAYVHLGDYENAIATFQQAIQKLPESPDRWLIEETLARLYIQIGDRENALDHLMRALALAPQDQQERIKAMLVQVQSQP